MRIGILGDFCLSYSKSLGANINKVIEDYSKSSILKELSKNDLNIANLEAPIINSDKRIKKTGPNLKNPEEIIDIFRLSKVQACTLANNHIYDYGIEGIRESIEICEKNSIKTVGAGIDREEILKPLIIEDDGIKAAIINFAENEFNTIDLKEKGAGSNGLDVIDIYNQINYARLNSDFLVIIAHGGHEEYHYPSPRIKKLYRFFVDVGADAVIGHHPHVIQGYEEYKSRPIFYSIGNYFFPSIEKLFLNHEGFVVILELVKDNLTYSILPYTQCLDSYSVNLIEGGQDIEFMDRLNSLSKKITDDKMLEKEWEGLVQNKKDYFINSLFPFNPKITNRFVKYGLYKLFTPHWYFLKILDLIRCESHKDLLVSSLKEKFINNKV